MRVLVPLIAAAFAGAGGSYEQSIAEWRAQRETGLKADDGWLTVAGLFWLNPGENRVGSDPKARVTLPAGPANLGSLWFEKGKVTFRAAGPPVAVNGKLVKEAVLRPDTSGSPDMVALGDLTFFIIQRDERFGVRLRDKNSAARKQFTGLRWYPVKQEWNKPAKFVRYPAPRKYKVRTSIGTEQQAEAIGYAVFRHAGADVKLEASIDEGQLFFVFRDRTSGKTTYPAARFLKADIPKDADLRLDFNKAYNPPCVFTPYATCPLPVAQNRLAFEIPAGELMYKHEVR